MAFVRDNHLWQRACQQKQLFDFAYVFKIRDEKTACNEKSWKENLYEVHTDLACKIVNS
jgi:hypothetical protein